MQFDAIRVEKEGSIMAFMNLFYKHRSVTVAKYGLVRDRSDGSGILRRCDQCVRLSSHSTAAAIGESLWVFQLCSSLHSGLRGSKHAAENKNVILCVINMIIEFSKSNVGGNFVQQFTVGITGRFHVFQASASKSGGGFGLRFPLTCHNIRIRAPIVSKIYDI